MHSREKTRDRLDNDACSGTNLALASQIAARFQSLHALSSEKLMAGEEAYSITKYSSNFSMVMKIISPQTAKEEIQQIRRLNLALPGISPEILYSDPDAGMYITTYAEGETLEKKISRPEFVLNLESAVSLVSGALLLLRRLHEATSRPYSGKYHEVIVEKRISRILRDPKTLKNISLHGASDAEVFFRNFSTGYGLFSTSSLLQEDFEKIAFIYARQLPKAESLIHGDPHFGNILAHEDAVVLIDPRITWDQSENKNAGYFDPLYDVACVAHSLVANEIKKNDGPSSPRMAASELLLAIACEFLSVYLQRAPTHAEQKAYLAYLACCMSGNLKYPRWTPSKESLWLTLHFIKSISEKISKTY